MEDYQTMKKRYHDELNSLPIKFAYSDEQFKDALAEMGLTEADTGRLVRVPGGGFMKKSESHLLKEAFLRKENEMESAIQADTDGTGFIFDMFDCELSNHEYCITGDPVPALEACGLSIEDVESNPAIKHGLKLAIKAQSEDR